MSVRRKDFVEEHDGPMGVQAEDWRQTGLSVVALERRPRHEVLLVGRTANGWPKWSSEAGSEPPTHSRVLGVAAAREVFATSIPLVVVCDLDLFDGSGIEVATSAQAASNWPVPIVVLSPDAKRVASLLELRSHLFVRKGDDEIGQLVRRLMQRGTQHRPDIVDYSLLARLGTRPVALDVSDATGWRGRVTVRSNNAWTAADAEGMGLLAFHRLARLRNTTIKCESLAEGSIRSPIAKPIEIAIRGMLEPGGFEATADGEIEIESPSSRDFAGVSGPRSRSLEPKVPQTISGMPAMTTIDAFPILWDRAVDLVLAREYAKAYPILLQCEKLEPENPSVIANLERLRKLGFGSEK